ALLLLCLDRLCTARRRVDLMEANCIEKLNAKFPKRGEGLFSESFFKKLLRAILRNDHPCGDDQWRV
ncbi:MAG: hypothetical protein ABMA14_19770, partial [Hyphomonadaceae bacterium]